MHKLLKIQLRKAYGKGYELQEMDSSLQRFIGLVDESYHDYENTRKLVEHTLEVGSLELEEVNQQIMESRDMLRAVTESIPAAIFYKDTNQRYIGCNHVFETFAEKSAQEIIGQSDDDLFGREMAALFVEKGQEVLAHNRIVVSEEWVHYAGGKKARHQILQAPLKGYRDEVIGLVGISTDITKEYEMEEELRKNESMLIQQSRLAAMGEMISNIAHQWRQPLNVLGVMMQNLQRAYERDRLSVEKMQESVEKGMNLITQMSRTIDDFRNFFKPGKEKHRFSLLKEWKASLAIAESMLKYHDITIYEEEMEDVHVVGFPNELGHCLLNLIQNAKDALLENSAKKKCWIKVSITQEESMGRVVIYDNGGGIPQEVLPHVFEPYFTTKEEGKGTGIGLYMSKTIIEKHMSGSIRAFNNQYGACFEIRLPLGKEERE